MPKRLLRIEDEDDTVTLVMPERSLDYALLSYCWGGEQKMTTRDTLTSYMRGIKIGTLAQTIRDAIRISKRLRIRYLWVDALCK